MSKLIAIGELLIDFVSQEIGNIKDTSIFQKNAGGAPANVCVCVKRLGCEATIVSNVGSDIFGSYLVETLEKEKIDISYIGIDKDHSTPLAFVSNDVNGQNSFSFMRKNTADLFLNANFPTINKGDIIHFCSVALVSKKNQNVHLELIKEAINEEALISFDVNLRYSLWENLDRLKSTVLDFIPYANILKLNDDELAFLGNDINSYFIGNIKYIILTKGKNGATLYTKDASYDIESYQALVKDTTGAGDAFIGAFIAQILKKGIDKIDFNKVLKYCSLVSSVVVSRKGAIPAMPYDNEIVV